MKTETLYHGTLKRNVPSILKNGILPRTENHYGELSRKYTGVSKKALDKANARKEEGRD